MSATDVESSTLVTSLCAEAPPQGGPSEAYRSLIEGRRTQLAAELEYLFPSQASLTLEIGCGHGHFLTAFAEAHRDRRCVGIDINIERVRRGERKARRTGLGTLHFVRAEAALFLEVLPSYLTFEAVFVLFPDPWPKKRHHKNRLLRDPFLTALADRTEPGAPLYLRTDYTPYFEEVTAMLSQHPRWEVRNEEVWSFERETIFQRRAESFRSLIARQRSKSSYA